MEKLSFCLLVLVLAIAVLTVPIWGGVVGTIATESFLIALWVILSAGAVRRK